MGNFILLPDGRIFLVNGGQLGECFCGLSCSGVASCLPSSSSLGTAGYGNDSFAIGHSYADDPDFTPLYVIRAAGFRRMIADHV